MILWKHSPPSTIKLNGLRGRSVSDDRDRRYLFHYTSLNHHKISLFQTLKNILWKEHLKWHWLYLEVNVFIVSLSTKNIKSFHLNKHFRFFLQYNYHKNICILLDSCSHLTFLCIFSPHILLLLKLFKWKLFIFFVESDTMKTFTSKYNQAKWPSWTVCFWW